MDTIAEIISTALTQKSTSSAEKLECQGICHNGPIDNSSKAFKYAADHGPFASAEFLCIYPCCDNRIFLCARKVNALKLSQALGAKFFRCNTCHERIPFEGIIFISLNSGS